jgi:hypothetical protein
VCIEFLDKKRKHHRIPEKTATPADKLHNKHCSMMMNTVVEWGQIVHALESI